MILQEVLQFVGGGVDKVGFTERILESSFECNPMKSELRKVAVVEREVDSYNTAQCP